MTTDKSARSQAMLRQWERGLFPLTAQIFCPKIADFVGRETENTLGLTAAACQLCGGALEPGKPLPGGLPQLADNFSHG
jgi:hypothetical protein